VLKENFTADQEQKSALVLCIDTEQNSNDSEGSTHQSRGQSYAIDDATLTS
jgi:hypothetical protein